MGFLVNNYFNVYVPNLAKKEQKYRETLLIQKLREIGVLWTTLIWWNPKKIVRGLLQSLLALKEISRGPFVINGVLRIWEKPWLLKATQVAHTLVCNMLGWPLDQIEARALTKQIGFLTQFSFWQSTPQHSWITSHFGGDDQELA